MQIESLNRDNLEKVPLKEKVVDGIDLLFIDIGTELIKLDDIVNAMEIKHPSKEVKREEFRIYLEVENLLELLTNRLVSLYQ